MKVLMESSDSARGYDGGLHEFCINEYYCIPVPVEKSLATAFDGLSTIR